jgi:alkaline phosphatase D
MALKIDRRLLLKGGALGAAALAVPARGAVPAGGFTHGVASGEPRQRSVLLWTRHVPPGGGESPLVYELSLTPDFARIVGEGRATAGPASDHCAKAVARGLEPGTWYYYRFRPPTGAPSATGRTRTLPVGGVDRFRLGIFSCANLGFGWFNAYAHAAARDDLDLIVHLGDYLYEYGPGRYPAPSEALAERVLDPARETVALADYRLRHATYRNDPDLQRLHARFPMIAMWDDHETANDAWQGGAENHQKSEGAWSVRKAAAIRAYREWMPVSDELFEAYEIGDLAPRLSGRSEPFDYAAIMAAKPDPMAALAAFRDGPWRDPARSLLGAAQEKRLAQGLRRSTRRGAKWQLLAQQVVMGELAFSPESGGWITPAMTEEVRRVAQGALAAARAGLPLNLDAWDGYPAARERLLDAAMETGANLIALSGDSHNAWAFDLWHRGKRAGVDMAVHSVTSPGFEAYLPHVPPAEVAGAFVQHNPALKWADTSRRGYMSLELTPQRATGEWLMLDTVRRRSTAIAARQSMSVAHGSNRLS